MALAIDKSDSKGNGYELADSERSKIAGIESATIRQHDALCNIVALHYWSVLSSWPETASTVLKGVCSPVPAPAADGGGDTAAGAAPVAQPVTVRLGSILIAVISAQFIRPLDALKVASPLRQHSDFVSAFRKFGNEVQRIRSATHGWQVPNMQSIMLYHSELAKQSCLAHVRALSKELLTTATDLANTATTVELNTIVDKVEEACDEKEIESLLALFKRQEVKTFNKAWVSYKSVMGTVDGTMELLPSDTDLQSLINAHDKEVADLHTKIGTIAAALTACQGAYRKLKDGETRLSLVVAAQGILQNIGYSTPKLDLLLSQMKAAHEKCQSQESEIEAS